MIAVFTNQTILDSVLPLPSGVQIGTPLQSNDGRVAVCYGFSDEDLIVLNEVGAILVDVLPADWQYPSI